MSVTDVQVKINGHEFTEAAGILGVSENWLREHSTRLPRHKYGKRVVFTDADLLAIAEMHHQSPVTDEQTPVLPSIVTALENLTPTSRRRRRAV